MSNFVDLPCDKIAYASISILVSPSWKIVLSFLIVPAQSGTMGIQFVKKQPSQDVLHGDAAEKELGLARLVSSYTLLHQNSQPGKRGQQTACSKVLSTRARDT